MSTKLDNFLLNGESDNFLKTSCDRLTSSTGALQLHEKVFFCTPAPKRWEEVSKILSDWKSFVVVSPLQSTVSSSPLLVADLERAARDLAEEEYKILQKPLFLELSVLVVDTPSEKLTYLAHDFTPATESLLAAYSGLPCTNRVVLAYHDGTTVHIFEGKLSGQLTEPRGPPGNGIGWDRIFLPNGFKRTINEMTGYNFSINVRNKPYLELGFYLRSHVYEGLFEIHVTGCLVRAHLLVDSEALPESVFLDLCSEYNCKPVLIKLPYGVAQTQMMTSSYHRGELLAVQKEAYRLCQVFAKAGFRIVRAKIEAMASSLGVPETTDEALLLSPENYFEFHVKLKLPLECDVTLLESLCRRHGAHLSQNAFKKTENWQERFLTLRIFQLGRAEAFKQLEDCCQDLIESEFVILSKQREYSGDTPAHS